MNIPLFLECSICKRSFEMSPSFFQDMESRICMCCGCPYTKILKKLDESPVIVDLYSDKDFIMLNDPDYERCERIKKENEKQASRRLERSNQEDIGDNKEGRLFETLQEMEDYKRLMDIIERKKHSPSIEDKFLWKERRKKKR